MSPWRQTALETRLWCPGAPAKGLHPTKWRLRVHRETCPPARVQTSCAPWPTWPVGGPSLSRWWRRMTFAQVYRAQLQISNQVEQPDHRWDVWMRMCVTDSLLQSFLPFFRPSLSSLHTEHRRGGSRLLHQLRPLGLVLCPRRPELHGDGSVLRRPCFHLQPQVHQLRAERPAVRSDLRCVRRGIQWGVQQPAQHPVADRVRWALKRQKHI